MTVRSLLFVISLAALSGSRLFGLTIALDYTLDTNNFFSDLTAKAAVDQAALDIGAVITSSLSAVDTVSFTVDAGGSDIATYNTDVGFTHPALGTAQSRDVTMNPVAEDTVVIYVGSQALGGSTLGVGGFTTVIPGGSFTTATTAPTVEAAADLHNTHFERGGGINISEVTQDLNGHTGTLRAGSVVGNLWFDHDTDNDTNLDTDDWHFDHTQPVGAGKDDLYSVALHEILHALGVGASKGWNDQVSGTTWLGSVAQAATGVPSGAGLVSPDGGHVDSSIEGMRLSDGGDQEVVMTPSLTEGTRKSLTDVDLAFIQDAGWTTIPAPIPEPGTVTLLLISIGSLLGVRRRVSR